MAPRTDSPWRQQAREVIAATLAALPLGGDRRKALKAAYPFGKREHHPYKIWCDEVRKALGGRPESAAPLPTGLVWDWYGAPHTLAPWLQVSCDWCRGLVGGGCMVCLQYHQALSRLVAQPAFRALRGALARGDDLARLVLADWLSEQGEDALAAEIRSHE